MPAFACPVETMEERVAIADAVFRGKLLDIQRGEPEDGEPSRYYNATFLVEEGKRRLESGDKINVLVQRRLSENAESEWRQALEKKDTVIAVMYVTSPDDMYENYDRIRQLYVSPCDPLFYPDTSKNKEIFEKTRPQKEGNFIDRARIYHYVR